MDNIVYYISADNDYYINKQGDYYIFSSSNSRHGYHTYIRINGQWKKVKPTITRVLFTGNLPDNICTDKNNIPIFTKDKKFFTINADIDELTAINSDDYIVREAIKYSAKIL